MALNPGETGNVIISGLTAAGKTTHARLLEQEFGLYYVSASETILKLVNSSATPQSDFWISKRGFQVNDDAAWEKVDGELLNIEATRSRAIFDCLHLPWLHQRPSLTIWLESSLPSRVMKAIVSYRGQSKLDRAEVEKILVAKDVASRDKFLGKYGVDYLTDRQPFDLILDISEFIKEPTAASSIASVSKVQAILSDSLGWYLTGAGHYADRIRRNLARYGERVFLRHPAV